jgi:hypothetical protein
MHRQFGAVILIFLSYWASLVALTIHVKDDFTSYLFSFCWKPKLIHNATKHKSQVFIGGSPYSIKQS